MVTKTSKMLTVQEVAARLNVSLRTAYRLRLPFVKTSDRLKRVRESDLDEYLRSRTATV